MNLFDLYQYGIKHLKNVCESPKKESEILLLSSFKITKSIFLANFKEAISDNQAKAIFYEYVEKRKTKMPLEYITGCCQFMRNEYCVESGVLIPRPETELLVEACASWIKNNKENVIILELGSGTGIISIELALRFPDTHIYSWDINASAYRCSLKNAERLGVKHINWIQGDFFSAKAQIERLKQSKKIGIVSNPPYIPKKDIQTLESSVKDFEPLTALDGGDKGLWFYQQLLKEYTDIPMFLEIGIDQKNSLVQEVKRYNIKDMSFENDYQDIPRVMKLNV